MAINLTTNGAFVGRHTPADANYPFGSAKNETSLGANDGSPYLKVRADDMIGLQQALLNSAGIVPSGSADTVVTSQYMEAITEIVMGRAVVGTEGVSAANAYVVGVPANQHPPKSLFDGLTFKFKPALTNTTTSTIDAFGLGVKTITGSSGAGFIQAGVLLEFQFNSVADQWVLQTFDASQFGSAAFEDFTDNDDLAVDGGNVGTRANMAASIAAGNLVKAWVNFTGVGVVTIKASLNVSSVTDNGVGDYTVNFATPLEDADYVMAGTASFNQNLRAGMVIGFGLDVAIRKLAGSARFTTEQANTLNNLDCNDVGVTFTR